MTNLPRTRPLSQVEVEQRIIAVIDALETATEEYAELAKEAATAEADYKREYAVTVLAVIQGTEEKLTVDMRTARVEALTADAHRRFLYTQATRNSAREGLLSMRGLLNGLQTLRPRSAVRHEAATKIVGNDPAPAVRAGIILDVLQSPPGRNHRNFRRWVGRPHDHT